MTTHKTSDGGPLKLTRDDFTTKTKTALALRAGYRCSFRGCGIATSGPADQGIEKTISIGEAAHVTAAAPGGPRYDPAMTPDQRAHISNGIWMCKNHARIIDVDAFAYPVPALQAMRNEHEARIKLEMTGLWPGQRAFDFIALGPTITFVGTLVSITKGSWSFRVDHFVIGDLSELIRFIDHFDTIDPYDRFVLVNELGEGRELAEAPSWSKTDSYDVITASTKAGFPTIDVHQLPSTMALGEDHDIQVLNGGFARVSGLDALPQNVKTCLSMSRGESWFAPDYGTRIREYTEEFFGSEWLPRLIKLEVIRMASIPYTDRLSITPPCTPLRCVRKVIAIEQMDREGDDGWFPFRLQLDIDGLGEWTREIPIFISKDV